MPWHFGRDEAMPREKDEPPRLLAALEVERKLGLVQGMAILFGLLVLSLDPRVWLR